VFQFGWGADALGFTSNHSVAPWLPLFMFVILFGKWGSGTNSSGVLRRLIAT
jgi:hypothetical protein